MAYTYLALGRYSRAPAAAFHLKHELERWVKRETAWDGLYRPGGLILYRIRSAPWESESAIVELEFKDDALIEKGVR